MLMTRERGKHCLTAGTVIQVGHCFGEQERGKHLAVEWKTGHKFTFEWQQKTGASAEGTW